jgi:nitrile hydratase accessory protein
VIRHALVEQLDAHGENAPPRINGELVFSAPWEGTVFCLAVALSDAGTLEWPEFQQQLQAHPAEDRDYYQRWLAALEHVLCRRGLLTESELRDRSSGLAAHHTHT